MREHQQEKDQILDWVALTELHVVCRGITHHQEPEENEYSLQNLVDFKNRRDS